MKQQDAKTATFEAMDKQIAFSWIKGKHKGEVQKGVYIRHSQELFKTYMMK